MAYRTGYILSKFGKELDFRFKNQYKDGITVKELCVDLDLPKSILLKLEELNIISTTMLTEEMMGIIKAIDFCYHSEVFLKNALSHKSPKTRIRLVEYSEKSDVESWIISRVFNLKENKFRVITHKIFKEVKEFFPNSVKKDGYDYTDIKKMIYAAKERHKYLKRQNRELLQIVAPKSNFIPVNLEAK